jgi:hypothetical protein
VVDILCSPFAILRRFKSEELAITDIELKAIAAAATIGK